MDDFKYDKATLAEQLGAMRRKIDEIQILDNPSEATKDLVVFQGMILTTMRQYPLGIPVEEKNEHLIILADVQEILAYLRVVTEISYLINEAKDDIIDNIYDLHTQTRQLNVTGNER
jgi:uncharacterized secreted protein with C-terminal beta-propeller domain